MKCINALKLDDTKNESEADVLSKLSALQEQYVAESNALISQVWY